MLFRETLKDRTGEITMDVGLSYAETMKIGPSLGQVFIEARDARTGEVIEQREIPNLIVNDAGILVARLLRDSTFPNPSLNNGLRMLAVGTGATGNILSPDAPQAGQRRLNQEIARKTFSATTYRDTNGFAVAYETNIIDFTTVFSEAEAVGPWNEMALIAPASSNPSIQNPIMNGPGDYDDTIDVTGKDLLVNYLTFAVISKPNTAVFAVTWRLTT
jgi:hypothetical protein